MTKKTDKATAKFFSKTSKSIGKGTERIATAPLHTMENIAEEMTSGPGIFIIIGAGLLGLYIVVARSR